MPAPADDGAQAYKNGVPGVAIAVRARIRYENLIENQRAEPYFCIESE